MQTPLLSFLLVALAGIALAVQSPLNAALGRGIGSGIGAAAVSFGIGFVVLLVVSALAGETASLTRIVSQPPVLLIGGALGALYVWSVLWAVPVLGALTTITALILGQMCGALVVDAMGLFGLTVAAITPTRLAAAALVAAGVVLSRF